MFRTLRLILLIAAASFVMCRPATAQASQSNRCCDAPPDAVVAIIDGESVSARDVEAYSRTADARQLFLLNSQLQDPRLSLLDNVNDDLLLEREAARLGMAVSRLLQKRLVVRPVTDAEIRQTFNRVTDQHPAATYAHMEPVIRAFLEGQRTAEARAKYVKELKKAASR
jgi:hypothetical protein